MSFVEIDPATMGELGDGVIHAYKSGRTWIVVKAYMLGQYRIQCWIDLPTWTAWPDIIAPEC